MDILNSSSENIYSFQINWNKTSGGQVALLLNHDAKQFSIFDSRSPTKQITTQLPLRIFT